MDNMLDLTGKVALVTGASSGLGIHFAKVLASRGAKVVLGARRLERLKEVEAEIKAAGGEALAVAMDVNSEADVIAAFDSTEEAYGIVNVLVNNAGVADAKRVLDVDEKSWDFVLDTNLKSVWRISTEACRRLVEAGLPGSVINISSILGKRMGPYQTTYATSKAAVITLSESMALDFAPNKIRVNSICPGYFVTEINRQFFESRAGEEFIADTPSGRTGNLDDITGPLLLLASDEGAYITGVALPVDGGHLLKRL